MANYYVNLSLGDDGHAGTDIDPFSFNDLSTFLNTNPTGHIFYMTGTKTSGDIILKQNSFLAWDLEQLGPWRMGNGSVQFDTCPIVSGCIIDPGSYALYFKNVSAAYNCYFMTFQFNCRTKANFFGCTFHVYNETSLGLVVQDINSGLFQDCVIMSGSITNTSSLNVIFKNCALRNTNPSFTYQNCQTNFSISGPPTWNAAQEQFDTSVIFAGLTSPPKPGFGSPQYTSYETDLWGNSRNNIGTGYMPYIPIVPVWVVNPSATSTSDTTVRIDTTVDVNSTVYAVVLPRGATAPSTVQVEAGTDSSGQAAINGNGSFISNVSSNFTMTDLIPDGTQYDIYCVAKADLLQDNVYGPIPFATPVHQTAPEWILTYPKTTIVRYTKASFLVEINMNGIAYFVILSKDSAAPSSSQVKAGTDSTDQPVSLGYSGSVVLLENVEGSLNAIDLVSGDYDVYFVAEGESLQDVPVMLPIQVPKVEPINPDKPGHTLYNVVLAGNSEVDSSLPKVTSMFRNIILPKTKNNK